VKKSRLRTIFLWVLILHISFALINKKTEKKQHKRKITVTMKTLPQKKLQTKRKVVSKKSTPMKKSGKNVRKVGYDEILRKDLFYEFGINIHA